MKLKVVICLNHPAHYFVFKYVRLQLLSHGHDVVFLIKNKDVLEKLLQLENVDYVKIMDRRERKKSKFSIIFNSLFELLIQDFYLLRFVSIVNPNILIGTDISITHIGKLKRIPSIVVNEDDFNINKLFCKSAYPFADVILAPEFCSVGEYEEKKVGYYGIQKMAYLSDIYFKPSLNQISEFVDTNKSYFVVRLVSLTAGHDIEGEHNGINNSLLDKIIETLEPEGRVIINCEGQVAEKYKKYILNLPANKMHHLIAFSDLFIGDSQTMCAEAGLLGVPFIRFNDFVGKIEYLNTLENQFELGYGIKTNNPNQVIERILEVLNNPNRKLEWKNKREKVFKEMIDVTAFFTWFIEHYPQSKEEMKRNSNIQYQIK